MLLTLFGCKNPKDNLGNTQYPTGTTVTSYHCSSSAQYKLIRSKIRLFRGWTLREEKVNTQGRSFSALSKFELKALGGADWRSTIYEGCRNRVMVTQRLVTLPHTLTTVAGFLADKTLEVTDAERQELMVHLFDELQLPESDAARAP